MGSINIFKPLSTFFLPAPTINLRNIKNKFSGMPRIKPMAAGSEARILPLCYCYPTPEFVKFAPLIKKKEKKSLVYY